MAKHDAACNGFCTELTLLMLTPKQKMDPIDRSVLSLSPVSVCVLLKQPWLFDFIEGSSGVLGAGPRLKSVLSARFKLCGHRSIP